jgi:hypothetical protein
MMQRRGRDMRCFVGTFYKEWNMTRIALPKPGGRVLERESVTAAFGVPDAAINPFYAALKRATQYVIS